jgi:hypothetical protein
MLTRANSWTIELSSAGRALPARAGSILRKSPFLNLYYRSSAPVDSARQSPEKSCKRCVSNRGRCARLEPENIRVRRGPRRMVDVKFPSSATPAATLVAELKRGLIDRHTLTAG